MAFDFSTLQKARAYSYLGGGGRLGKLGACTWYSPWDCYTSSDVQAAKEELENAHNVLLDFVNGTQKFYDDAVANGAPGDVTSALGADVQNGYARVQEHSNLMSKFYAETGTGISGLTGLQGGGGRLGFLVLGWTLVELATFLGAATKIIGFAYLGLKLGELLKQAAITFQENFKADQEKFKRDGQYYMAWKDAKEKGLPAPPGPDDSGITDWTTIALIAGSIALLFVMGRK